ncbi:hypothetical protein B0E46_17005 [Rhodanobacter sp. B04]|nr:hypothetical protein B0E46_17005 [Rhodanobacter sp. B04]
MGTYVLLFNVLYVCVVLLRINDAQVEVKRAGLLFRQQRYVECYLAILSNSERSKWYNIFLKYSFDIQLVLSTAFLFALIAAAMRGWR